jgi:hypothetical protein
VSKSVAKRPNNTEVCSGIQLNRPGMSGDSGHAGAIHVQTPVPLLSRHPVRPPERYFDDCRMLPFEFTIEVAARILGGELIGFAYACVLEAVFSRSSPRRRWYSSSSISPRA